VMMSGVVVERLTAMLTSADVPSCDKTRVVGLTEADIVEEDGVSALPPQPSEESARAKARAKKKGRIGVPEGSTSKS